MTDKLSSVPPVNACSKCSPTALNGMLTLMNLGKDEHKIQGPPPIQYLSALCYIYGIHLHEDVHTPMFTCASPLQLVKIHLTRGKF